jgi:hypothetical protein
MSSQASYALSAYRNGARVAAENAGSLTLKELGTNWLVTVKDLGTAIKKNVKIGDLYFTQSIAGRIWSNFGKPAVKSIAMVFNVDEQSAEGISQVSEKVVSWGAVAYKTLCKKEVREHTKEVVKESMNFVKGVASKVVQAVGEGGVLPTITQGIKNAWNKVTEKVKGVFSTLGRITQGIFH